MMTLELYMRKSVGQIHDNKNDTLYTNTHTPIAQQKYNLKGKKKIK